MSKLSDNLRLLRKIYGLSVRQVAQTIERSASSVSNWENDRQLPDIAALESLCKLYKVYPDEILGWRACSTIEKFTRMQSENLKKMQKLMEQRKELDEQIRKYEKIFTENGQLVCLKHPSGAIEVRFKPPESDPESEPEDEP